MIETSYTRIVPANLPITHETYGGTRHDVIAGVADVVVNAVAHDGTVSVITTVPAGEVASIDFGVSKLRLTSAGAATGELRSFVV